MAHITTGLICSIIVFILIMHENVSKTIPKGAIENINTEFECYTDEDCFEKNTYCDISLNLCSQCLNCSIYFRTFKTNIKCPKDITECSNCLDGYMKEIFFGGETRDLCVPLDSNNILPTPAKITSNYYWQSIGVILILVCNMFIILLFWTYFYKRSWNTNSNVANAIQNNVENPPPSYHSCMKLENYVTDDVQEFHLFTGETPPRNEWRHQNAVPFRLQDNCEETNIEDENENNEETDGAVMREFEDPELHDEETMPSTWTPYSEPEIRMDFENINFSTELPPFKRIRLVEQTSDEKSYQDQDDDNEDNASDISQDDEL